VCLKIWIWIWWGWCIIGKTFEVSIRVIWNHTPIKLALLAINPLKLKLHMHTNMYMLVYYYCWLAKRKLHYTWVTISTWNFINKTRASHRGSLSFCREALGKITTMDNHQRNTRQTNKCSNLNNIYPQKKKKKFWL